MATQLNPQLLDLDEQLTRIRKIGAETEKALADIQKTRVDIEKVVRETRIVTAATVFQGGIAVAALLGAGAALAKVFFP
jgi:hypothetical protein